MRNPIAGLMAALCLAAPGAALAQATDEDGELLSPDARREQLGNMIPQNESGQLGALAPQNLNADRPEPPIDITGTWFVDLSGGFGDFLFGAEGYPEFIGQAKEDFAEGQRAQEEGRPYRDAIGQCYPAGLPMIMTRVWPIAMIQLPTAVYMVSNFNNSFRQIFLDGRDWSDPDYVEPTYNGESHGHWEGDTLVVETRYFDTFNHYIDRGIPISPDFKVIERIDLVEDGTVLQIEYIMTDPNMWEGEWRSTKRWLRVDQTDIGEVECLPDMNANLPSTQAGQVGLE